jgi:ABC-type multidrug transport system ATPase subunit
MTTTDPVIFNSMTVRVKRRTIVDRLTIEVPRGSVFALLGRNGAGKTTAFRCLLGLRRPDEGEVLLFGRDAWRHRASAMARIGVVPEEPDVPSEMSAAALARFSAPLYARWDQYGFRTRLRRANISDATPFGKLSRGQKTQVMLAAALAIRPEVLLLDDPTLGLDPIARKAVLGELIGELADFGTTMLLATHDIAAIEGLATHVGVVREGKLVLSGELDKIKAEFGRVSSGPWRTAEDPPASLEDVFAEAADGCKREAA